MEIAAANDGGEVEIAIRGIVHGVAEDSAFLRGEENGAIYLRVSGGGDGEEYAFEI